MPNLISTFVTMNKTDLYHRRGVLGEIQAIYSDFGLLGFYRGMVPKILGETCQTLTVGALAFFVSNQAPGVQEIRSLLNFSFSVIISHSSLHTMFVNCY